VTTLDPRNVSPGWRAWKFWSFIVVVVGGAVAVLAWRSPGVVAAPMMPAAFWVVAALVVFGELRPVFTAGSRDVNGLVTSTTFVFAVVLHWGLGLAIILQCVAVLVSDIPARRAAWRTAFNMGQYALSWSAAAGVLSLLNVHATPAHPLHITSAELPAIVLAAVAYFVVNDLLVSIVLALRTKGRLRDEFFDEFTYQLLTAGALLALSPLVVLAAERSAYLVPLIVVPLLAVYQNARVSVESQYHASHDSLTGLPNRKHLTDISREAVRDATSSGKPVGLLLLDLDKFKEVNDTLGHHVGDQLLQEVGRRLRTAVRPGDTVTRLGGDEFAVLLPELRDQWAAEVVAGRIVAALEPPFGLTDGPAQDTVLDLGASIGVALAPGHAEDFETLLQRADVAMYVAKERGRCYSVYSVDADRHSPERLSLLGELRILLHGDAAAGGLEVHYQPQIALLTGEVVGVEALVRWRHPRHGLLTPDAFVPVAEQSALIHDLTRFVIDTTLAQVREWLDAGLTLRASVNVSVRDLHRMEFADFLAHRLVRHRLAPDTLELEITEGALMADPGRVLATLQSLEDLGVGLALDDFGTGYSSLSHLRRMPVSEIKIDRGFVSRMAADLDDETIVRSIIDLAGALGLRVIAEGVEDESTWRRLAALGCDEAQGWFFARPKPAEELTGWLAQRPRFSVLSVVEDQTGA
jgi:diguanylate cyclase (GGDEF)-like protein